MLPANVRYLFSGIRLLAGRRRAGTTMGRPQVIFGRGSVGGHPIETGSTIAQGPTDFSTVVPVGNNVDPVSIG